MKATLLNAPCLYAISFSGLVTIATAATLANAPSQTPYVRARRLVEQMSLDEKIELVHGNHSDDYIGWVPGNARLGIPELRMQDGPQGFRTYAKDGSTTQWPSGMTGAMSWDDGLMDSWGQAMGEEFRGKGANVFFGPAVNLHRVPQGGRNFEYLSGEDPYLGYRLVQPLVRGIQKAGVIANIKHFIDNEQEGLRVAGTLVGNRHIASSEVDERTQVEMYFMPFLGAIEAGVLSTMCGNNIVNGVHACEDNTTLNTMLREWFGFKGFVLSDYRGAQSTMGSALGGLDIQTPGCTSPDPSDATGLRCKHDGERPNIFGQPLRDAVLAGTVPEKVLDQKVERVLYAMIKSGLLDRPVEGNISAEVASEKHRTLARRLARRSCVLMKNENNLLPLDPTRLKNKTIALIGSAAHEDPVTGGGGSGAVEPASTSTVLDGLRSRLPSDVSLVYDNGKDASESARVAAAADYAIIVLGAAANEGSDRQDLMLKGDEVVPAVAAVQDRTVVLAAAPGAFLTPWLDDVRALMGIWYTGQEQGAAVASLLLGHESPSGKLIFTMPNTLNEMGMPEESYPGKELPEANCTVGFDSCYALQYSEGLEVGYRWYQAHGVTPKFSFGHGLTYTTWKLDTFGIIGRKVSVTLHNTGMMSSSQVVQLYITYPAVVEEPPRQLRDFQAVYVEMGMKANLQFVLDDKDMSIWNTTTHDWEVVNGSFVIEVGFSSSDLPWAGKMQGAGNQ